MRDKDIILKKGSHITKTSITTVRQKNGKVFKFPGYIVKLCKLFV